MQKMKLVPDCPVPEHITVNECEKNTMGKTFNNEI